MNYLRNLFSALAHLEERKVEPVLFVRQADRQAAATLAKLVAIQELPGYLDAKTGRAIAAIRPLSWLLWFRYLARERIALLSHSPALVPHQVMPSLGMIYDFQHKHLPELFSEEERSLRDRSFREVCRESSLVLVSSACALTDLQKFLPGYAQKARVLRFVANLAGATATPLEALQAKYQLPARYLYLPNQFWKHKNHATVIRALAILKRRGASIPVIASGADTDYRHPRHFADVMAMARELEVQASFRVLGVVPHEDLLGLMQHSAAVLNPSLFEGWSTTVEEAKSMGKLVILSSIPVHLEQRPERSLYFEATSAEELAGKMAIAIESYAVTEDFRCQAAAREALCERVRAYARAYQDIALSALAKEAA